MLGVFDREYFKALIILLPGFISYEVVVLFSNPLKLGEFEIIATSLTLSIVNAVFAMGIYNAYQHLRGSTKTTARISYGFIALLFGVAVATGVGASWITSSDLLFRTINPGVQTSLDRPFVNTLKNCRPVQAKVYLSDGRIYRGFLDSFSSKQDVTELVLTKANIEIKDVKKTLEPNRKVILFGKDITGIELLRFDRNGC